jgi:hypothetical protein
VEDRNETKCERGLRPKMPMKRSAIMQTVRAGQMATILAILVLCASLSACSDEGQVLDRQTNSPLPGVFVIAEWHGQVSRGIQAQHRCYHAEVTVTDGSGRFQVAKFSGSVNPLLTERLRSVNAYKPGYREAPIAHQATNIIYMEPRTGSQAEQFERLSRLRLGEDCDESQTAFLPARRARALELTSRAITPAQVEIAEGAIYDIETIEIGDKKATENFNRRAQERSAKSSAGVKP